MSKMVTLNSSLSGQFEADASDEALAPFGVKAGDRIQIPKIGIRIIRGVAPAYTNSRMLVVWYEDEDDPFHEAKYHGAWTDAEAFGRLGFKKL